LGVWDSFIEIITEKVKLVSFCLYSNWITDWETRESGFGPRLGVEIFTSPSAGLF